MLLGKNNKNNGTKNSTPVALPGASGVNHIGDRFCVHIENLSVGGRGVARHQGLVLFVPDTAPDEDVEVEITYIKKNFAEARVIRILRPSPQRRSAPCPVAGICGGCNWQHVNYSEQLAQKRAIVLESLRRIANIDLEKSGLIDDFAIVPCPNELFYRNRVQFHHEGNRFGFFKRGTNEIVDIDECLIVEKQIGKEIPRLKQFLASKPPGRSEVFIDTNGVLQIQKNSSKEESHLEGAFAQVNTLQNENLITKVLEIIRGHLNSTSQSNFQTNKFAKVIYDFYAGNGNFTFPIASQFPQVRVFSVELNELSVKQAQARLQGLVKKLEWKGLIDFCRDDVCKFLKNNPLAPNSVVLLDPPRTGCESDVLNLLLKNNPELIVYVSCNPVTLSRDIKTLTSGGYVLSEISGFDMFPQTDHIETITVLRPKT